MSNKILLAALAATFIAMTAPAMASASTPVPDLPSGVHQAYLADSDGNPTEGTVTLTGSLNTVGALTKTCDIHAVIDYYEDGTTAVTSFTATNCVIQGALGSRCTVATTPTNLSWGDRFGFNTSDGKFRDYVNVDVDTELTQVPGQPPCPVTGTFTFHGTLSPEISISGSVLSMTFGSGSGSVTSVIGTQTWNGTLSGTVPSGSQLIF